MKAIKYTRSAPEIYISTKTINSFIQIEIKDNGVGISEENQKKIFHRFYRVPTGNLHDIKGFGLGLNYVKSIVDAHKGKISIESEPGKGSTFKLSIPIT